MCALSRRKFILNSAGVFCASVLTSTVSGCATVNVSQGKNSIDYMLRNGARVMWIGAHPDDEILVGSLMAKSSLVYGNPLFFLVMNHGDGGECCLSGGCHPDVSAVRGQEMIQVAQLYHAQLQHEYYYNAPLPVSEFPKRHEIAEIWRKLKDPKMVCAKAIRKFRPDVLFTFSPEFGATGHPEHQLASRFATAGVRMAADPKLAIDNLPSHRVNHVYFGLNRHWLMVLFGRCDPEPAMEIWDATQPCKNGLNCRDTMAEFTKPHCTQANDMGAVRRLKRLFGKVYLYKTDPFTDIKDPFEPVLKNDI